MQEKFKASKDTKQLQTQDVCFEVRATALLPAFTAVKGFHYPPRTLQGLSKIGVPNFTTYKPLPKRYLNKMNKEEQVAKWSLKRIINFFTNTSLFTTPLYIENEILALRSVVRKTQL